MNERNPYADDAGYDEFAGPDRTSALAVTSLILSIVCCIPGLGVLGAGLGIGALIGIGGSRGRVGGKGLAIAGIIIGILVSVAWIGGYFAFQAGVGQMLTRTGDLSGSLDSGDYDGFRSMTMSPASDLSDAEYDAFVADYQAQLGGYAGVPDSMFEYFENFSDPQLGQSMQGGGPVQNAVPVTVDFDNGTTLVFLVPDQVAGDPFTPGDLVYLLPDGTMLTLSDYRGGGAGGSGSGQSGSGGDADGDEDDGSDADSDEPDGP